MTSIYRQYNFNNKVHQQNLPKEENQSKAPPMPNQDLSWWRRLLNFFKNLFDRIFNRKTETQQNNATASELQITVYTKKNDTRNVQVSNDCQPDPHVAPPVSSANNSTSSTQITVSTTKNDTRNVQVSNDCPPDPHVTPPVSSANNSTSSTQKSATAKTWRSFAITTSGFIIPNSRSVPRLTTPKSLPII